jgi:hypothetical protein
MIENVTDTHNQYLYMHKGKYMKIERVTPNVIYLTCSKGHYGIWRKDIVKKNLVKKATNILNFEKIALTS